MNKALPQWLLLSLLMFASCTNDELSNSLDRQLKESLDKVSATGSYDYYIFPQSDNYAILPHQDPENPVSADKVFLGKMLFHDTGLALAPAKSVSEGTYSCASCHIASNGFTPGRFQGVADGGIGFGAERGLWPIYESNEVDAQGVRPLSILNVTYVTNTLWSGIFGARGVNVGTEDSWENDPLSAINFEGLEGLESQNIEGLGLHRLHVDEKALDEYGYRELFDTCFPNTPEEERYTEKTASYALGSYLRTVLANEAPFQSWLKGDDGAITDAQKRGALLFLGKANCYQCHKGPSFNSMEFHALGTADLHLHPDALNTSSEDRRNLGRAFFTQEEEDFYKFKVPQLYNLRDYSHFFHGSSKTSVKEVVEYKVRAQSENGNVSDDRLSEYFVPLTLTEREIEELVDFLENALHDPNLERYVPDEVPSGNCFPNNDPFSKVDLGCE